MTHLDLGQKVARHRSDFAAIYDIVSRLERRQEGPPRHVGQPDVRVRRMDGIESQIAVVIDLVSRDRR